MSDMTTGPSYSSQTSFTADKTAQAPQVRNDASSTPTANQSAQNMEAEDPHAAAAAMQEEAAANPAMQKKATKAAHGDKTLEERKAEINKVQRSAEPKDTEKFTEENLKKWSGNFANNYRTLNPTLLRQSLLSLASKRSLGGGQGLRAQDLLDFLQQASPRRDAGTRVAILDAVWNEFFEGTEDLSVKKEARQALLDALDPDTQRAEKLVEKAKAQHKALAKTQGYVLYDPDDKKGASAAQEDAKKRGLITLSYNQMASLHYAIIGQYNTVPDLYLAFFSSGIKIPASFDQEESHLDPTDEKTFKRLSTVFENLTGQIANQKHPAPEPAFLADAISFQKKLNVINHNERDFERGLTNICRPIFEKAIPRQRMPAELNAGNLRRCLMSLASERYPNTSKVRPFLKELCLENSSIDCQIIVIQQFRDTVKKAGIDFMDAKQREKILNEAVIPFLEELEDKLEAYQQGLLEEVDPKTD